MTAPRPPTARRMLLRGLVRRCPRCGSGHLFRRWFVMVDDCPGCQLHFEREEGYWTGAMVINLAVTYVAFLGVFIGLAALTWPDVPWGKLLAVVLVVNAAMPILFYPRSKTLWVAADLAFRHFDVAPGPPPSQRAGPR